MTLVGDEDDDDDDDAAASAGTAAAATENGDGLDDIFWRTERRPHKGGSVKRSNQLAVWDKKWEKQ